MPDLVIFDCDGVLVDSERIENAVMRDHLARHGLDWPIERVMAEFVGFSMAAVTARAEAEGARLPADWLDAFTADSRAALSRSVTPVRGVEAVLDRLEAAGIPVCVVSNGAPEKMAVTLGRTGLIGRFGGRLFSAYEVGIAKPDPGLFLHAAGRMGAAPGATVVVEDSPTGARGARAAGMRCLGYAAETPAELLAAEGAEVFADMAELPRLLGLADV